jgi:glyoxalase family protein
MRPEILGLHHVTAIATDPQTNVDFYSEVLGLRLVKKTVNFDDPGTYHLYYGDELGRPGTILTFFPWPLARRGSRGSGQATACAFSVPESSIDWWRERLSREGIVTEDPVERFDEQVLALFDPDGLRLELVGHSGTDASDDVAGPVPMEFRVRGLHSVAISVTTYEATMRLLTETLGFRLTGETENRSRLQVGAEGDRGARVDVLTTPQGEGWISAGTVHHVAWRAAGDREQMAWRERLLSYDLNVTPVLDRGYFRSIYFREPGGVLFEIATDPPGFAIDEPISSLGSALKLPAWLEDRRATIEATLPSLKPQ